MRTMNYKDQLKSPKWQKKRLEIMKRDKFTCKCCFSEDETLSVHHKYYKNNLKAWEYPSDCYITLCEDCHKIVIHQCYDNNSAKWDIECLGYDCHYTDYRILVFRYYQMN